MSERMIVTRRDFLGRGLGIVGVGAALPHFLVRSALAGPQAKPEDRIVVSLLLGGGHDGLSSVPPYAHEEYYRRRTTTRIEEREVVKLNDEVGLHPGLAGFRELLDQKRFSVVLGTGYPARTLSHFIQRDIWEAGRPGLESGRKDAVGWLGRYIDHRFRGDGDPKRGLSVGPGRLPMILTGREHPGVAFSSLESFRFTGESSPLGADLYRKLNAEGLRDDGGPDAQFLARTAVHADESSRQIQDLLADLGSGAVSWKTGVTYPETRFGNSLRTIAALIGKGLSTRVYFAEQGIGVFGGYDTHADQKPRHAGLMDELCRSVTAFYADLQRQGNAERVLTFTFSEFGRRVEENHSGGTDHGLAQPMFLFGPMVKPGVHGKQPGLRNQDLDENGNLKMQVDFRRVYAAILEQWLQVPSEPILGDRHPRLDCLQG